MHNSLSFISPHYDQFTILGELLHSSSSVPACCKWDQIQLQLHILHHFVSACCHGGFEWSTCLKVWISTLRRRFENMRSTIYHSFYIYFLKLTWGLIKWFNLIFSAKDSQDVKWNPCSVHCRTFNHLPCEALSRELQSIWLNPSRQYIKHFRFRPAAFDRSSHHHHAVEEPWLLHANATTLLASPCFTDDVASSVISSPLQPFLFLFFWCTLIFISSVQRMLSRTIVFLSKSKLVFLFLRPTDGLHLVKSPLSCWPLGGCCWSGWRL